MRVVAYLSNQFPSPVEPYVWDEIQELRRRGVKVVSCSARRSADELDAGLQAIAAETLCLQPLQIRWLVKAAWFALRRVNLLADLVARVLLRGSESPGRRVRALLHTWLGAYYAQLPGMRGVQHIHAHHGYFSSWIAMVAARLLGISFSMTLHGSDLLLHRAYLDVKLKHCKFCVTISEFNRQFILEHYPEIDAAKVRVCRMGVHLSSRTLSIPATERGTSRFILLAVGRLHPVKDHAFLVRACAQLKKHGAQALCLIAGEGPERAMLERLIRDLELQEEVGLLGHLPRPQLDAYYAIADLVVLTSRSEGIPVALMEAMAHGKVVLAPAITGIPELVLEGRTGFLYHPGSIEHFVAQVRIIRNTQSALDPLRQAARRHVLTHFNHKKNLASLVNFFLASAIPTGESHSHENPVLQQI